MAKARWSQKEVDALKAKAKPGNAKIPPEKANAITKNIIRAINSQNGCVAYRVNNVGVWDEEKQIRRKGNTEKGLPDVWSCLRGRFVVFEVKAGKDKLSEDQEKRKFEIERAKGLFIEVETTDFFLQWFSKYMQENNFHSH